MPVSLLPRLPGEPAPANGLEERFLAFGRVLSGVVREGQRVHVLSAAYDPSRPGEQRQSAVLGQLYLMMGRGLERLQVGAGQGKAWCCRGCLRGSQMLRLHQYCFTQAPYERLIMMMGDSA